MQNITIKISFEEETRHFTFWPSTVHTKKDDKVTWESAVKGIPFAVHFPDSSPFEERSYFSHDDNWAIVYDSADGSHSYVVAVVVVVKDKNGDQHTRVFAASGPEIVVLGQKDPRYPLLKPGDVPQPS